MFGLWALTDQTIRTTVAASARKAVDVDLAGLVDIYATSGRSELERRIADRLAITPSDGSAPHYLLADGAGARIAGDIVAWPRLDAGVSESGTIRIGKGTDAFARATRLAPDLQLVVARETGDNGPLLRHVAVVFLGGGALFVLLVGGLGRIAAGRLHWRIERVNDAFRDPDDDRLAAMGVGMGGVGMGGGGGGDEIDELTGHSAAALARQKRLIEAYRDASDQVAHEIRTPLMHLDGRLTKALAAGADAAVAARLVEARGDIKRLVAMLESLLDIASSKARQGDRHGLRPVDLSEMVTRICELYADSAEESGHVFTWAVAPGVVFDGEETQLGQLVTNLLDNAFKYVPAGGAVRLTLAPGPVIEVADDGPGVPDGERERIFERFHRSRNATPDMPGSGLGLALARAIAERHELTIELAPSDTGARFVVKGRTT
ncbi:sensor histidine kinase [Sphingopyxis sp.]|uniref:sensor histidine kinase n=1 Tax=Sphingopyxis sp. TaxID=1908224 RepID=UPI003D80F663